MQICFLVVDLFQDRLNFAELAVQREATLKRSLLARAPGKGKAFLQLCRAPTLAISGRAVTHEAFELLDDRRRAHYNYWVRLMVYVGWNAIRAEGSSS